MRLVAAIRRAAAAMRVQSPGDLIARRRAGAFRRAEIFWTDDRMECRYRLADGLAVPPPELDRVLSRRAGIHATLVRRSEQTVLPSWITSNATGVRLRSQRCETLSLDCCGATLARLACCASSRLLRSVAVVRLELERLVVIGDGAIVILLEVERRCRGCCRRA